MSNSLSTSRSCQKLMVSGMVSTILPATGGPSIQADFEEPTVYTVEFRVSNTQNINVPAGGLIQPPPLVGNITPTATLQWSLGGNTIYRKMSVFSGASISGVCEHLVASVSDETILPVTFQFGINLTIAGKRVVGVNTVAIVNVVATSGLAQSISGVALNTDGMVVLLTNQTSSVDNGPYIVHAGAWTRLPNLGIGIHAGGSYTLATQGTYAGQWWGETSVNGVNDVVNVNGLTFNITTDPTFQSQYSLTIVGGEGVRPATALPPAYQTYLLSTTDSMYRYGSLLIPSASSDTAQVPVDVGVTSVMITAGSTAGVANEAVTGDNFIVVFQSFNGSILKYIFPPDTFIPVPSQTASITAYNLSGFEMLVSFTWGIDG